MTHIETVPVTWDSARDEVFFRVVARLFTCAFLEGASSMLAANDAEPSQEHAPVPLAVPVGVRPVRA